MPKNKVKTIPVNKEVFTQILKMKNSSIRKLGASDEIPVTEKTIRRALNNGEMRPELVKQIAKHLNVESDLLTGEMLKGNYHVSPLNYLDRFPYFRTEQRELLTETQDGLSQTGGMQETIRRLLSLFDISYDQYKKLSEYDQCSFLLESCTTMLPVIKKYFSEDDSGRNYGYPFEKTIHDLEDQRERIEEMEYIDTVRRQEYLENPPKGLTKKEIKTMTREELYDYDIGLQLDEMIQENSKHLSLLDKKYAHHTVTPCNEPDKDIIKNIQDAKDNPTRKKC